jgi:thioredoxin-like negative regulator of GroEL
METAAVRVRTGQHAGHGRVVLHLGQVPAHAMRKVGNGFELRLRGQYRFDLSGIRRLAELTAIEPRSDGADTLLLLRGNADQAEAGAFGGMLYVDLRAAPAKLETAQRKLLDDAVRLGLMKPDQAHAMLRAARTGGIEQAAPVPPGITPAVAAAPVPPPALAAQAPAPQPPAPPPPAGDLAGLREAVIAKLAVLNGLRPADTLPATPARPEAVAAPSSAPVPAASAPAPVVAMALPTCPAPFSLSGWSGEGPFADHLPVLRAALARSDQGAAEVAALAEFYAGHQLSREALSVLEAASGEWPAGALKERLERVRDVARLLLGRPISPASPLLAEAGDCAREDLPLWRALAAAVSGDAAALAPLAPRTRAALRGIPQDLRLSFVQRLADAVENDPATLRVLLGAVRAATGLTPEQAAARNWQYARLARQEGNRADEQQYLEQALRGGGRSLPEIFARARMAALNLGRSGAEGRRAEAQINELLRTYRHDALGEEAAIAYASRLLEQGALGAALGVADGTSQASARPGVESRGARLAATALRRLLADPAPEGPPLPSPDERLGLFWQYEGYATPGERGDDIRLAAMRLLLRQGLAEAARDLGQQITPATVRTPQAILLLARAEAEAAQGDPRRALALLAGQPGDVEGRRIAASALARLGRPEEAAAQLDGLREVADLSRRAELLFQARAWRAAGTAYGALLREPSLPTAARADATARLASATTLAQGRAEVPAELLVAEGVSAAMLRLNASAPPQGTGITGVREAIERSRQIEALLPPATQDKEI